MDVPRPRPRPKIQIRRGRPSDLPAILAFIRELASYERLRRECVADEGSLRRWLFGRRPAAEVLIGRVEGRDAGFALFFQSFSTFLARPGLFLEDVFVRPEFRGQGLGRKFLERLAAIATARGFGRVEWNVLEWNRPAIRFYESIGAKALTDWRPFRVSGKALSRLARA